MYLLYRKITLKLNIRQGICFSTGCPILFYLWGKKGQMALLRKIVKKHISVWNFTELVVCLIRFMCCDVVH